MKKNKFIFGLLVATIGMTSCNPNENIEVDENTEVEAISSEEVSSETSGDLISVEEIDQKRSEIESLKVAPLEVSTSGLRAKIKQKWSKLHFYVENDVVVKVKTYSHSEVSKRTEEFYADKNGLLLVVIEDNGDGTKGKEKIDLDKMYYFNNGKLIKETNKEEAVEYTVKEGDAEELLSEFNEYLDLYKKRKK